MLLDELVLLSVVDEWTYPIIDDLSTPADYPEIDKVWSVVFVVFVYAYRVEHSV